MTLEWYPVIDYKKCKGCMTCVNFCPHGVFSKENDKPKVTNKELCVDLCKGCEKICPEKAISHYSKENVAKLKKNKNSKEGCSCNGNC